MSEKLPLNIPPLTTVSELRDTLIFLENNQNMTQVRNSCQLIQLTELLRNMNNNYNINRGQWYLFLYSYMRVSADICEGLLFAFHVKQSGRSPVGRLSLEDLINLAKATHKPRILLSKRTKDGLEKLLFFRNNLHPSKQKELHTKMVEKIEDDENRELMTNVHTLLISDLKQFYGVK
jgi:GTPase SAR1 family protein